MDNHPIDIYVGNRVRQRRSLLGMSQTTLATAVGLTFQQIQKYERGLNRVSASRLYEFAAVLDVPVTYFFDELPGNAAPTSARKRGVIANREINADAALMTQRETLKLVRSYYMVQPRSLRTKILETIRGVASESQRIHKSATIKAAKPASRRIQRERRSA